MTIYVKFMLAFTLFYIIIVIIFFFNDKSHGADNLQKEYGGLSEVSLYFLKKY